MRDWDDDYHNRFYPPRRPPARHHYVVLYLFRGDPDDARTSVFHATKQAEALERFVGNGDTGHVPVAVGRAGHILRKVERAGYRVTTERYSL